MNNTQTQHTNNHNNYVVGRFAPSPTGQLHVGSLITAVASYCHIKSLHTQDTQAEWIVRIEDTDTQRCKQIHSDHILKTLHAFGLHWDRSVIYQSKRLSHYDDALHGLLAQKQAYACECSRKSLADYAKQHPNASSTYPKLCAHKQLDPTERNLRLCVPDQVVTFEDEVQGTITINPQTTLGDMILKRRDGIVNYLLSSVVDDAAQGVTHILRGLDLLELTPSQIALARMLKLPNITHYGHLPLACNTAGQKLSKQTKATPIDTSNIAQTLLLILDALQQSRVAVDTPERMIAQAVDQWDISPLLHTQTIRGAFV